MDARSRTATEARSRSRSTRFSSIELSTATSCAQHSSPTSPTRGKCARRGVAAPVASSSDSPLGDGPGGRLHLQSAAESVDQVGEERAVGRAREDRSLGLVQLAGEPPVHGHDELIDHGFLCPPSVNMTAGSSGWRRWIWRQVAVIPPTSSCVPTFVLTSPSRLVDTYVSIDRIV